MTPEADGTSGSTMAAHHEFAFVFVHSYSSAEGNWLDVMVGIEEKPGRILRAHALARQFGLKILANDSIDTLNCELLARWGIENSRTARNTLDEVEGALAHADGKGVIFVTSPDHLPRVVRDVMAAGGTRSLFAASSVPFSQAGAAGVEIEEPAHLRPIPKTNLAQRS